MAASLLSESAGDEPTASVGVDAGLAIVRPVMSWKGRFNSKILLKLAKSIAQMANCPQEQELCSVVLIKDNLAIYTFN